ncbi:hypothetical protein BNJ_00013 [Kaumoebavirus]|uniref:hypothetical protein n=1 Tax=Kaumoebavirus TaxID=1859492 RepID=UPI0009C1F9FB|nr:hypothetical protein BNJ_00013 [Kaumoebavirus]ARA71858.1 hypothetical protein BNJ_00013 [Kaumoebavirus]
MQRKIAGEEIVDILDEWLPREITDEILAYVVWRPKLINFKWGYDDNYHTKTFYKVNGYTYTVYYDGGGNGGNGRIMSGGNGWKIAKAPLVRKFWNGEL